MFKNLTLLSTIAILMACMPASPVPTTVSLNNTTYLPASESSTISTTITPKATNTFVPTLTSRPRPTSIPCGLKETSFDHEWCSDNVLIDFYISIGDGGSTVPVPLAPDLILYPDGKMFIVRSEEKDGFYSTKMLYKQFDRKGVCQILNTFDQIGYLNYDPLDYQFVGGDQYGYVIGADRVYLNINAWKPSTASYYALNLFLSEREKNLPEVIATPLAERVGWPIIDSKLMNAFYFMNSFPMNDFVVYQPEKLGVWLTPLDEKYLEFNTLYINLTEWDVDDVSLNEIAGKPNNIGGIESRYAILMEKKASEVFSKLDHSLNTFCFLKKILMVRKTTISLHLVQYCPMKLLRIDTIMKFQIQMCLSQVSH